MKKSAVIIFVLLIVCGCSSYKSELFRTRHTKNIILEISEYQYCYFLKTRDLSSLDTTSIIAHKAEYSDVDPYYKFPVLGKKYRNITVGDTISFSLKRALTRADWHGYPPFYLIVVNDTLCTGKDYKKNFYYSVNSVGLQATYK